MIIDSTIKTTYDGTISRSDGDLISKIEEKDELVNEGEEEEEESNEPSHFQHQAQFFELFDQLILQCDGNKGKPCQDSSKKSEGLVRGLVQILELYQSQTNLLDQHYPTIIHQCCTILLSTAHYLFQQFHSTTTIPKVKGDMVELFGLIYNILKLRGWKVIVNLFPNEVKDVEPLVLFLFAGSDLGWMARYVLLLWLSNSMLLPFDLDAMDSELCLKLTNQGLVDHLTQLCKDELASSGKVSHGAAILLARMLSRHDVRPLQLPMFLDEARLELLEPKTSLKLLGWLRAITTITKTLARPDLLPYLEVWVELVQPFLDKHALWHGDGQVRKLGYKLVGLIGLGLVKPNVRGGKQLIGYRDVGQTNLECRDEHLPLPMDAEFEVPEFVEAAISTLFDGLNDKEMACRWTSAKLLGRLASRLPGQMISDILDFLIDKLEDNVINVDGELDLSGVEDHLWHGTSLSLAELVRRGLVQVERVEELVEVCVKILSLDLKRGSHQIGSNVRDAGCFVLWSLARAYPQAALTQCARRLGPILVNLAVFDAEINVRRAASATFQEFVGRAQCFSDGIEMNTTIDYFKVGNITNAFLKVVPKVSTYDKYQPALISELIGRRSCHHNVLIRRLASKAIIGLGFSLTQEQVEWAVKYLLNRCNSPEMAIKHGAYLSLSSLLPLSFTTAQFSISALLSPVLTLTPRYLTTFGSVLLWESILPYLTNIILFSHISSSNLQPILTLLTQALTRSESHILDLACQLGQAINRQSLFKDNDIESFLSGCEGRAESRLGYIELIGKIVPVKAEGDGWDEKIFDHFVNISLNQDGFDMECRRASVQGLDLIVSGRAIEIDQLRWDKLVEVVNKGAIDYTTTDRGDTGSKLRAQACLLIGTMFQFLYNSTLSSSTTQMTSLISHLLVQSLAKIDKLRHLVGQTLRRTLCLITNLPGYKELEKVVNDPELDWTSPSNVYPKMTQLLASDSYRKCVLEGLVVAGGGMAESLIRYAGGSLLDYLIVIQYDEQEGNGSNELEKIAQDLIDLIFQNKEEDRILIPGLEVIGQLVEADVFIELQPDKFAMPLGLVLKGLVEKVNVGPRILIPVSKILAYLSTIDYPPLIPVVFRLILKFLTHPNSRVRLTTSDHLYITLQPFSDSSDPHAQTLNHIYEALGQVDFSSSPVELRKVVFPLYDKVGLKRPILKKKE